MFESLRSEFEAWVSGPPYSRSIARHAFKPPYADAVEPWVAGYCDFAVEIAWRAWQHAHIPSRVESTR